MEKLYRMSEFPWQVLIVRIWKCWLVEFARAKKVEIVLSSGTRRSVMLFTVTVAIWSINLTQFSAAFRFRILCSRVKGGVDGDLNTVVAKTRSSCSKGTPVSGMCREKALRYYCFKWNWILKVSAHASFTGCICFRPVRSKTDWLYRWICHKNPVKSVFLVSNNVFNIPFLRIVKGRDCSMVEGQTKHTKHVLSIKRQRMAMRCNCPALPWWMRN